MKKALTIAGSDSGGCAGIQADLKSFHANSVFGMSVVTAVTAQNTLGVSAVFEVPLDIIASQIDAIFADMGADVIKTGMLSSTEIIDLVSNKLKDIESVPFVLDPVMVATSGAKLISDDGILSLKKKLLPMAKIVTPNIKEAEILSNTSIMNKDDMYKAGEIILEQGCSSVLIKGGHLDEGECIDILMGDGWSEEFSMPRVNTKNTHGTGCTLSAAIAANLAKGMDEITAAYMGKVYITKALEHADDIDIGNGSGSVHHFYMLD